MPVIWIVFFLLFFDKCSVCSRLNFVSTNCPAALIITVMRNPYCQAIWMYRTELRSPFFIYTNAIKRDLAENKSWLKVICTYRNINTVNSVYTNLHVSLLNNTLKTKIPPVARFIFRKFILLYISKNILKHFLAALLFDMKCAP